MRNGGRVGTRRNTEDTDGKREKEEGQDTGGRFATEGTENTEEERRK